MSFILGVWRRTGLPIPPSTIRFFTDLRKAQNARIQYRSSDLLLVYNPRTTRLLQNERFLLVGDFSCDQQRYKSQGLEISALMTATLADGPHGFAERLPGRYLFAALDRESKELHLARDFSGSLRLFYFSTPEFTFFCDRQIPMAILSGNSRNFNMKSLFAVLNCDYRDDLSDFEAISTVRSGTIVTIDQKGNHRAGSFGGDPAAAPALDSARPYPLWLEHFQTIINNEVLGSKHGHIGTDLSGGLDSSIVTGCLTRSPIKNDGIHPFAFKFNALPECDESTYSRQCAQTWGLRLNLLYPEEHGIYGNSFSQLKCHDFPFFGRENLLNQQFHTLRNLGGDLHFTGHGGDTLTTELPLKTWHYLNHRLRYLLSQTAYRTDFLYRLPFSWRVFAWKCVGKTPYRPAWIRKKDYWEHQLYERFRPIFSKKLAHEKNLVYMRLFQLNTQVRRACHLLALIAETHNIRVVHPFMNPTCMKLLTQIPQKHFQHPTYSKHFLREAGRGLLPEPVRLRQDKPSLVEMYHRDLLSKADTIKKAFKNSYLADLGMIEPIPLLTDFQNFLDNPYQYSGDFSGAMQLEFWLRGLDQSQK